MLTCVSAMPPYRARNILANPTVRKARIGIDKRNWTATGTMVPAKYELSSSFGLSVAEERSHRCRATVSLFFALQLKYL
jgi:hypothetical protein